MPVIFNAENKLLYEHRLLDVGLDIIKQNGLKSITVDRITHNAGFAKSTFYTFFQSKEEFIYKIAVYQREKVFNYLEMILKEQVRLDAVSAKDFFRMQFLSDSNIYPYLTSEDYAYLRGRCPELFELNIETDEKHSTWLLSKMDTTKKCDWKLFSNYIKAIITVTMNTEFMYKDILEQTVLLMIDGLIAYIFQPSSDL